MTNSKTQSPVFWEIQRFKQWWIWLVVWGVAVLAAVTFVVQIVFGHPVGNNPASDSAVWIIFFLVGIGFPLLTYSVKLTTELYNDRLILRYTPFWTRTIPLDQVVRSAPRIYRPIMHYAGWGIRYGLGRGWCYTVYGNRGVELELRNGKSILVGSQRPEELATAIDRAKVQR
jgi:hypothetical protein